MSGAQRIVYWCEAHQSIAIDKGNPCDWAICLEADNECNMTTATLQVEVA